MDKEGRKPTVHSYLQRECPHQLTPDAFASISQQLLQANGFPNIYHPSADRIDDCAAGRLLLLTPWHYQFRPHDAAITVPFCKTMNCIVQAVCRTKDDWWKITQRVGSAV